MFGFITPRIGLLLAAAIGVWTTLLTFEIIRTTIDLYYAADAAHYAADARAILGIGVRDLRHAPLFPVLVAVLLLPAGSIAAFHGSIALALFLLPVSMYVFARQWFGMVPSLAAAAAAAVTPMIGDVVGWSGGATLIAVDMSAFGLAALERWIRSGGRRDALLFGAFAGLTLIAHPFTAAGLLFLVSVRWAAHAAVRRRFSLDWSPLGARGIASCLAVAGALGAAAASYYLRLRGAAPFVSIDPVRPVSVILTGTRENVPVLFFLLLGTGLPLLVGRRSLALVSGAVAGFALAVPLLLAWDISYNLRVVYLLPLIVAAGVGSLVHLGVQELPRWPPARRVAVPILAALLVGSAAGAAYGFGYPDMVRIAGAYYQRVHEADLPAFQYLASRPGVVATSWSNGFYDEGKVNAWFVEGLSNRPALGPGAPWTWTLEGVGEVELDLQRFFAGEVGIENGAVQASASTAAHLADPAIQVNLGGFYYPLAYVNAAGNTFPFEVDFNATPSVIGDAIVTRLPEASGAGVVVQEVRLDPAGAVVTYRLEGGSIAAGDWDIWVWPAYFEPWLEAEPGGGGLETIQAYRPGFVRATYSSLDPNTTLQYHASHPTYGVQALQVNRTASASVAFRVTIANPEPPGALSTFDELTLIARHGLESVLVWKDTGWMFRFDGEACYARAFETPNLVAYAIEPACRP